MMANGRRRLKRILLTAMAVAMALAIWLYVRTCQVPAEYAPVTLTVEGRAAARLSLEDTIKWFLTECGEIGSYDPTRPPNTPDLPAPRRQFQMELTQSRLNEWLAIKSADLDRELKPAQMSAPAVALAPDRLTLYVHWDKHDKILGLDITPKFSDDGSVIFELTGLRIGSIKLPRRVLSLYERRILATLKKQIRDVGAGKQSFAGQPTRVFQDAAGKITAALAGQPVRLDLPRHIAHVRIGGIETSRGRAVINVVSLLRD